LITLEWPHLAVIGTALAGAIGIVWRFVVANAADCKRQLTALTNELADSRKEFATFAAEARREIAQLYEKRIGDQQAVIEKFESATDGMADAMRQIASEIREVLRAR
jgi:hypothetical protein